MKSRRTRVLLLLALVLAIGTLALTSRERSSAAPALSGIEVEPRATELVGKSAKGNPEVPAPMLRMKAGLDAPALVTPHQSFRQSMRDQMAATDAELTSCLLQLEDPRDGDGSATLTFIMARGEDSEIVIEDTGIDFDETTIENEELVKCMSRSAEQMVFTSIPEGVDAVSVTRRLVVSEGAVSEHKLTEYANLRDSE